MIFTVFSPIDLNSRCLAFIKSGIKDFVGSFKLLVWLSFNVIETFSSEICWYSSLSGISFLITLAAYFFLIFQIYTIFLQLIFLFLTLSKTLIFLSKAKYRLLEPSYENQDWWKPWRTKYLCSKRKCSYFAPKGFDFWTFEFLSFRMVG